MATTDASLSGEELVAGTPAGESRSWRWHPDVPIGCSPLFTLPLNPVAIIRWFASQWLPVTEFAFYALLAFIVWRYVQPPLSETATLAPQWLAALWLRNLVMMIVFATALHLWFYRWRGQGDRFRYMRQSPTDRNPKFLGNSQLRDNVTWTLASGVTLWSIYEAGMWLAYANGVAPTVAFADHPVWFVLWFALIGIWQSFHFYCVHRMLHWKPLYRYAHSVHHRNVTIGPWSGFSMHPLEHILYLSSLLIHLVVPSHPVHMLFHAYWLTLATATSHSGYQALAFGDSFKINTATFFHQLHHRYFTCNYGNVEVPLDRWFGSFNDGTSAATRRLLEQGRPGGRAEKAPTGDKSG